MNPKPPAKRGLRRHRRRPATAPDTVTPERWVAWRVIERVMGGGAWADRAFRSEADKAQLEPRRRRAAQMLAYGTIERIGTLDYLINAVGKRPLTRIDPPLLAAIRLGAFQLVCTDEAEHAGVDQSVEIVRAAMGERPVPFANAVLRRLQAHAEVLLTDLTPGPERDAVLLSVPEWMLERGDQKLQAALAAQARTSLRILDEPAPSPRPATLRIRPGATAPDEANPPTGDAGNLARWLPDAVFAEPTLALDDTRWVRQSLASMLVVAMLAPASGEQVLDSCAAPGGKTLHIADSVGPNGAVTACEIHDARARALEARLATAGVGNVTVRAIDATDPDAIDARADFDRVLVDAPCSGLGVIGSRPDLRWRRRPDDIPELVGLQRRLLAAAAQALKPGGVLVYSTCTLLTEENEAQAEWITRELGLVPDPTGPLLDDAQALADAGLSVSGMPHAVRTWPQRHGTDGFFMARFRKGS